LEVFFILALFYLIKKYQLVWKAIAMMLSRIYLSKK